MVSAVGADRDAGPECAQDLRSQRCRGHGTDRQPAPTLRSPVGLRLSARTCFAEQTIHFPPGSSSLSLQPLAQHAEFALQGCRYRVKAVQLVFERRRMPVEEAVTILQFRPPTEGHDLGDQPVGDSREHRYAMLDDVSDRIITGPACAHLPSMSDATRANPPARCAVRWRSRIRRFTEVASTSREDDCATCAEILSGSHHQADA